MSTFLRIAFAGALLAMAACKADRPTEFVNVVFTVSHETSHYRTWDFELESSENFAVDWVDHDRIREHLLVAVEDILSEQGYERVPGGSDVDFHVSYELWVTPEAERGAEGVPARGSLVIRDGSSGAFIWRATRKAPVSTVSTGENTAARTREFASEMLKYFPQSQQASAE